MMLHFHMNADKQLKKANTKLNCCQMIADRVRDCISANASRLFCSPHGLFTCIQPKVNTHYLNYEQNPECFQ